MNGYGNTLVYNEGITISKDGTSATNPVRIIGYTGATPVDGSPPAPSNVPLTLASALTRNQLYSRQTVLDGQSTRDNGIDFNGKSFVEVYNFDIINFKLNGVLINGLKGKAKSIFLQDIGYEVVSGHPGVGVGVQVYNCLNASLQDVVALNCRMSGIWLTQATECVAQKCDVYNTIISPQNTHAGTDYYFYLGVGKDCVLQDCKAERGIDATHPGHGYVMQAVKNVDVGVAMDNCPGNDILNCQAKNVGDPILLRGRTCNNIVNGFTSTRLDDNVGANYGAIRLESGPSNNEFRNIRLFNSKAGLLLLGWDEDHLAANFVGNKFVNCLFETKDIGIWGYYSDPDNNPATDSPVELHNTQFVACTFQGKNPSSAGSSTAAFQKMDRRPVNNVFTNCVVLNYSELMPQIGYQNPAPPAAPYVANNAPAGFSYHTCRFYSAGLLSESFFVANLLPGSQTSLILPTPPYGYNSGYTPAPYYYFLQSGPLGTGGTTPPSIIVGHGHIGYFHLGPP